MKTTSRWPTVHSLYPRFALKRVGAAAAPQVNATFSCEHTTALEPLSSSGPPRWKAPDEPPPPATLPALLAARRPAATDAAPRAEVAEAAPKRPRTGVAEPRATPEPYYWRYREDRVLGSWLMWPALGGAPPNIVLLAHSECSSHVG